ncbi:putative GroES-like superfamily, alcohol dehydrogenase-like, NAD(P)-binding domain superfamily [Septoria linicola]|nr:putative GroES-like superfamily, alcohol dehydrogenase-like, NAD(P)-binding domain superfamily [Septoria linicola]
MPANQSAFLDGENHPLRIADSAIPKPGANDIVVRNYAVAVNTIDPAQAAGFKVRRYPTVLGHDLAGEVFDVGQEVTRFKKGDRVIGHSWQFVTGNPEDGAFSLYTRVPASNAAVLPSHIPYTDGAVLPLAIDTAAAGFYQKTHLNLDLPSLHPTTATNGKVIIVYGGSSSVGALAIQLAVNAGYRVLATASPKNFGLCRECGASAVFDYKSTTLVDDIAQAVGRDKFVGLYNAIGVPESFEVVTPVMQKLGGGIVANTKPPGPLPEQIEAKFVLGVGEFSFPLWESYIGEALTSGQLKCLLKPKVVGKGLHSLQAAFDARDRGVSGEKIVVEL